MVEIELFATSGAGMAYFWVDLRRSVLCAALPPADLIDVAWVVWAELPQFSHPGQCQSLCNNCNPMATKSKNRTSTQQHPNNTHKIKQQSKAFIRGKDIQQYTREMGNQCHKNDLVGEGIYHIKMKCYLGLHMANHTTINQLRTTKCLYLLSSQ